MVSSKDIQNARRIALRTRASAACLQCKVSKTKCNDYRPCKRCKSMGDLNCYDTKVSCQCQNNLTTLPGLVFLKFSTLLTDCEGQGIDSLWGGKSSAEINCNKPSWASPRDAFEIRPDWRSPSRPRSACYVLLSAYLYVAELLDWVSASDLQHVDQLIITSKGTAFSG